ncbi:MAG: sugar ABC transporter permease [Spirochaetaceae bacterium]|jgi:arabinosaccharide transport system permease protein|nr:sugar ABC transporter permease [Spirochaetaceae bacterium]
MAKNILGKNRVSELLYNWKVAPYVFVLPFLLSFSIFWVYPLFSTVKMSFQDILPGEVTWVGLDNFRKLLKDRTFFIAIGNSFLYMGLTIVLLIPFPMLFAVLMDSNFVKAKGVFKAILYMPALTSVVVSGTIFRLAFAEMPNSAMNQIIALFGHEPIRWLGIKGPAFFALVLICCWRWTGVNMLYFLAGLKGIDTGLYESAEIDGATKMQKFWYITLPLLNPTTIYVLTISIYAGLSMFMEVFMLMGNGGPRNIALTIVGYLYRRGIERNQLGYASAVGIVLLVIALAINTAQLTLTGTLRPKKER